MTENQKRADRAYRLGLIYRQWIGAEEDDPETVLADLLADMMHEHPDDFDAALDRARRHFEEESGPECESCLCSLHPDVASDAVSVSGFVLCSDCIENVEVV